jgi:hypothetical protein
MMPQYIAMPSPFSTNTAVFGHTKQNCFRSGLVLADVEASPNQLEPFIAQFSIDIDLDTETESRMLLR